MKKIIETIKNIWRIEDLRSRILLQKRRQVERQTSAREDYVGFLLDRGAHHIGEVGQRHHNIDSHDTTRQLACLAKLLAQAVDARLLEVVRVFFVDYAQSGR